ncbi:hypothetical protein LOZ58_006873 [Ophidiomyces ophidiicola]|nr:hypothetical protein LOZ58_006873 [Ophidiomyces ophidiicola]
MDESSTTNHSQELEWVAHCFPPPPEWIFEPDIKSVKQAIEQIRPHPIIKLLAQDGFIKVYNVKTDQQCLTLRVARPTEHNYRTVSEVATIDWIRRSVTLPAPRIVAYSTTPHNSTGFEWILMDKIPGRPLSESWRAMTYPAKETLVRQFTTHASITFRNKFHGIGNIYPETPTSGGFTVGPIAFTAFFLARQMQETTKGPFYSSKDWLLTILRLAENPSAITKFARRSDLQNSEQLELDGAESRLTIIKRLESLVWREFPDSTRIAEPTMIFHQGLSLHNILVDGDGTLVGVRNWDCASALPAWKACSFPAFLEGPFRPEAPDLSNYELDAESHYWDHLLEHEQTKLRQYYLDEMERLEPEWVEIFRSSTFKRDIFIAIKSSNGDILEDCITEWLDERNSMLK